jgi:hypothetical protein
VAFEENRQAAKSAKLAKDSMAGESVVSKNTSRG